MEDSVIILIFITFTVPLFPESYCHCFRSREMAGVSRMQNFKPYIWDVGIMIHYSGGGFPPPPMWVWHCMWWDIIRGWGFYVDIGFMLFLSEVWVISYNFVGVGMRTIICLSLSCSFSFWRTDIHTSHPCTTCAFFA